MSVSTGEHEFGLFQHGEDIIGVLNKLGLLRERILDLGVKSEAMKEREVQSVAVTRIV